MRIPPFLLDQWIATYEFASPPIRYNLAASTGPGWTLGELLALGDGAGVNGLDDLRLSYAPPQGTAALREQVAALLDVYPDWVVSTTRAFAARPTLDDRVRQ